MSIIKKSDLMDFADALYFMKEGKTLSIKSKPEQTYTVKGKKIMRSEDGHVSVTMGSVVPSLILSEEWFINDKE